MKWLALALLVGCAAAAAACDRPPSGDGLKEWSPVDHDGEKKSGAGNANQGPKSDAGGAFAMVEITWRNQCATCHGVAGKADGPQAAMFKPADLSKEEWQGKVNDDEIATTIKNGKGRMPKFDLPDDVVQGLVARIRTFRGK